MIVHKTATAFFFLALTAAFTTALAKDIEVAIIGLADGGAPAIEESFDKRLREKVAVMPDLYAVDYLQSQTYRRKIRFDEFSTVSRKLVEALKQYCTDTTVFVWGSVKNYGIQGERRDLIKGFVTGNLTVSLTIYSLRYKDYAFTGDIAATTEIRKGFVFFGSAREEILISALDKKEITEQLLDKASLQSAAMIEAVIRSERLHAEKEAGAQGAAKYEIPSVSDMFNMPSVEAASVNRNRGRPKIAADSLPGRSAAPKAAEKPTKSVQPADTGRVGAKK